jgi:nucleobase:cation symporter-1, NCS1 family
VRTNLHFTDGYVDIDNSCLLAGRTVPLAATRIYEMSFFTGFGVSALIYYTLNVIFPVPGKYATFEEVDVSEFDKSRGSMVDDERDADSKKTNSVGEAAYPA